MGNNVCIRAKWFYSNESGCIGQRGCYRAGLLYRGKMVVFEKKLLYSGKSCCFRTNVAVFKQMWLYSGKVVLFRQKLLSSNKSGCIRAIFVFKQCGCIRAKVVVIGQNGIIRTRWLNSDKFVVFWVKVV